MFNVIQLLAIRLLQIFAHAMTAWLLWHVQNFVATKWLHLFNHNDFSIEFELYAWNSLSAIFYRLIMAGDGTGYERYWHHDVSHLQKSQKSH